MTGAEQVAIVQGETSYRATAAQIASVDPVAPTTFAALPTASVGLKGARAVITDASASTYLVGASVSGGGSSVIPVFCNGVSWLAG